MTSPPPLPRLFKKLRMRGTWFQGNRSVLNPYMRIPPYGDFSIIKICRKVAEEPGTKQAGFFNSGFQVWHAAF